MKRRKWTNQQKLQIVLEGIKGKVSIAELCNKHQIAQAQYYQWRDRLLQQGAKVFDLGGANKLEERLRNENNSLKALVGELTVELKKSEEEFQGL